MSRVYLIAAAGVGRSECLLTDREYGSEPCLNGSDHDEAPVNSARATCFQPFLNSTLQASAFLSM